MLPPLQHLTLHRLVKQASVGPLVAALTTSQLGGSLRSLPVLGCSMSAETVASLLCGLPNVEELTLGEELGRSPEEAALLWPAICCLQNLTSLTMGEALLVEHAQIQQARAQQGGHGAPTAGGAGEAGAGAAVAGCSAAGASAAAAAAELPSSLASLRLHLSAGLVSDILQYVPRQCRIYVEGKAVYSGHDVGCFVSSDSLPAYLAHTGGVGMVLKSVDPSTGCRETELEVGACMGLFDPFSVLELNAVAWYGPWPIWLVLRARALAAALFVVLWWRNMLCQAGTGFKLAPLPLLSVPCSLAGARHV